MASMSKLAVAETAPTHRPNQPASGPGQIVLVLQGGGALGAYQAGVYQALHEIGIEPDWIIGTSIGAINASLIAGNQPPRTAHTAGWGSAALTKSPAINTRNCPQLGIISPISGLGPVSD